MWGASLESVGGWGGVSLESVGGASESVGASLVVACTRVCMHTLHTSYLYTAQSTSYIRHTIISIINSMAKSAIWD